MQCFPARLLEGHKCIEIRIAQPASLFPFIGVNCFDPWLCTTDYDSVYMPISTVQLARMAWHYTQNIILSPDLHTSVETLQTTTRHPFDSKTGANAKRPQVDAMFTIIYHSERHEEIVTEASAG
jgi:hypothetical protein